LQKLPKNVSARESLIVIGFTFYVSFVASLFNSIQFIVRSLCCDFPLALCQLLLKMLKILRQKNEIKRKLGNV